MFWVLADSMLRCVSQACGCYVVGLIDTLNLILSVTNLSRLERAETQCARKPRAYEER